MPGRDGWQGGAAWLRTMGKQLSPEGERCAELVDWWQVGIYHLQTTVMNADWSNTYVELHLSGDLCTFDNSTLTRLVVGAHDAAIRVELSPCMRYIRLRMHPRCRHGYPPYRLYSRHPTIEAVLQSMTDLGDRLSTYEEEAPCPTPPSPNS